MIPLAFALIRDPMLVHWLAEEDVLDGSTRRAALRQSLGSLKATELEVDVLRRGGDGKCYGSAYAISAPVWPLWRRRI